MKKTLYRSRDNRTILGICGGIGKYFDVDPVLIRVFAVLTFIWGGGGLLVYLILYFVVPLEPLDAGPDD